MCDPSVEPAQCGKSPAIIKPLHCLLQFVSHSLSPTGKWTYLGNSTFTIAAQVSLTIQQTVHRATPNSYAIVWYSDVVARTHSVIATLCCTDIAFLNLVLNLMMLCSSWLHMYRNVSWLTLKFSIQSRGVNVLITI